MGAYHGEEGFRELSHAKTVFRRRRYYPTHLLFHPPYRRLLQKAALKLFLGSADPGAR
jgi:coniferyl-aldehyde dehydrogenase